MSCPLIRYTHKSGRKTPRYRFCQVARLVVTLRQTLLARILVTLSKAKAMNDPVTEDELVRARIDPAFRQQFLAQNLDRLLEALKKTRLATNQNDDTARQIREGADLAVKLAGRLQRDDGGPSGV
jgi:DNA-binding transcriptional LysR family regulator